MQRWYGSLCLYVWKRLRLSEFEWSRGWGASGTDKSILIKSLREKINKTDVWFRFCMKPVSPSCLDIHPLVSFVQCIWSFFSRYIFYQISNFDPSFVSSCEWTSCQKQVQQWRTWSDYCSRLSLHTSSLVCSYWLSSSPCLGSVTTSIIRWMFSLDPWSGSSLPSGPSMCLAWPAKRRPSGRKLAEGQSRHSPKMMV